jgi:hypothetical protein
LNPPPLRPDNPFTRFLCGRLNQTQAAPAAEALIEHCDRLEALVIRVYRAGSACAMDVEEYLQLQGWLQEHYPAMALGLEPYWRGTKAGDAPVIQDPLLMIYNHRTAEEFVDNWQVMQLLPAAREALNQWLRDGAKSA